MQLLPLSLCLNDYDGISFLIDLLFWRVKTETNMTIIHLCIFGYSFDKIEYFFLRRYVIPYMFTLSNLFYKLFNSDKPCYSNIYLCYILDSTLDHFSFSFSICSFWLIGAYWTISSTLSANDSFCTLDEFLSITED